MIDLLACHALFAYLSASEVVFVAFHMHLTCRCLVLTRFLDIRQRMFQAVEIQFNVVFLSGQNLPEILAELSVMLEYT